MKDQTSSTARNDSPSATGTDVVATLITKLIARLQAINNWRRKAEAGRSCGFFFSKHMAKKNFNRMPNVVISI